MMEPREPSEDKFLQRMIWKEEKRMEEDGMSEQDMYYDRCDSDYESDGNR